MSAQPADTQQIRFEHPVAFWSGTVACTVGVLMHLPMYYDARTMGYQMAGMRPDAVMLAGMALIGAGLIAALYGLVPRGAGSISERASLVRVRALDDAPIRWSHIAMLLVLAIAITIDAMKPVTLSFVAPGMTKEYGLKSPLNPLGHVPVSWLPLAGIGGTVVGSWLWGLLGDRIGRRASILFAALLFTTTSICGAMPGFSWNLLMCFLMGIGVGGMLPIAFALIAEIVPARHRGWLMVLIGGNAAAAYALTSWLSAVLIPHYSWRIMWLIGLPTGLLLIALNHWIPESPRYLIAVGRQAAAVKIMARYGARFISEGRQETREPDTLGAGVRDRFGQLFAAPFLGTSLAITIMAAGIGLVAFGFQLWIPTNLQHLGFTAVNTDYTVRNAALIGLPFTLVVAWLYGFWSTRKTITALSALTVITLLWFVLAGDSLAHQHALLTGLLVIPLSGTGAVVAVLSAYASEIYPTRIRSRGTGHAAAMTKAGGVLIIAVVVAAAAIPSLAVTALIGAIPLGIGTAIFARRCPETIRRPLDAIGHADMPLDVVADLSCYRPF
jgi:putative MFS transporter